MTDIIFSFDAEDFTSNEAADAIKREADILYNEGIKGSFCLVGYLADQLVNWGRDDVLESLSHHEINLHTLGHTYHPMINEYTDIDDFYVAREEVVRQEGSALEKIEKATGVKKVYAAVPPGNQKSYVAMYAYADMGIPIFSDTFCDPDDGRGAFYCNIYNVDYVKSMEDVFFKGGENALKNTLDEFAKRKRAVFFTHPHASLFKEHWDVVNYDKENTYRFGEWKKAERRPKEQSESFFSQLEEAIKIIKNDPRFRIVTFSDIAKELEARPERRIEKADIPALRDWIKEGLRPTEGEGSLSVADIFLACRDLLSGKESHVCKKVKGFLETPFAVKGPKTFEARDIRDSSKSIPENGFLPPKIWVNGTPVGPADWLRAALDVLCGETAVTITPGEQLVSLDILPRVKKCSFKNTWRHSDGFEDKYLSDRLRLQCWTMRY